ncbi:hypothetical protein, partial [Escherichia coli]
MQLNGPVVLNAQEFSNRAGAFLHSDTSDTHIRIKGRLDNRDGTLASNASHIVVEGQFDNRRGNVITSGDATLQATDLQGAGGSIVSNGALDIRGDSTDLSG